MALDAELPKLVGVQRISEGLRILTYQNNANPTLAAYGSLQAGSSFDPEGKSGIAELTSRLLLRGSRKLGAAKMADQLESVGAAISFRNTQDNIVFQARTTSTWTLKVLGILAQCLTKPAFNTRDIEKEKEQLLTEIRLRDDDTTRRGLNELHRLVYPLKHPYRRDKLGTSESVQAIQRRDILDYFETVASKAQVVIALAGHMKPDQLLSWAEESFPDRTESYNHHGAAAGDTDNPKPEAKQIIMPHKTQSDILLGAPAMERRQPDYEPLNLLNVILGELGFMGRLGQRVRDKEGLAYSCTSFLNAATRGGSWTALAGVNPRNVARAAGLMKEEIARVGNENVTGEELEAAKQNQIGSALMELESTEGVARTSHNLEYFGLGLDYFAHRRELYQKISTSDLLDMARKYLDSKRISTIIVGPKDKTAASKS
ncbi:insulinase family protein [Candidatus Bathyarchaeota archaeon]|nr:MAG: insulinase family protein [Candidatus Bathyarchaeota archaeon]